jgi:hypothetical protein
MCEDGYGDPVVEEEACDETCDSTVECCTHADCGDGNYCYDGYWGGTCYSNTGYYNCCYYNDSIDTDCDGDVDLDDCPQDCSGVAGSGEGQGLEKVMPSSTATLQPGYNPEDEDMLLLSKVYGMSSSSGL